MASFREILLKTVGDGESARRDLKLTAAEIRRLDAMQAEVEVMADTDELERKLAEARADLERLDKVSATADADVNTAEAIAKIRLLEARLAELGARDVDVDVDVNRGAGERAVGFLDKIKGAAAGALSGLNSLAEQGFQAVGQNVASGFLPKVAEAGQGMAGMARVAGIAAAAIGVVLVSSIYAAIAALALLVASASFAAGALGALAVAAGALLVPFAALAIGAIARFKDTADQAGSAANRLKTAATGLADNFKKALAPAADAVFKGLARGFEALAPMISKLKPAFTAFGQVAGKALGDLLTQLSSPKWRQFFTTLIGAAAQALPPLVRSFTSLLTILRNIATAAMPFLIAGFRSMAKGLSSIAKGTSDTDKLGSGIGRLVEHLKAWLDLAGQLGRIFIGFIKGAEGPALRLVQWLADGARAIADWINSAEGQATIKQFFEDMLPLVQQVVEFWGRLIVIGLRLGQAIAPALTSVMTAFNAILTLVGLVVDAFLLIPSSLRGIVAPLGTFAGVLGTITTVIQGIPGAFQSIASAASNVFARVRAIASGAFAFVRGIVTRAVGGAWAWIRNAFNSIKNAVQSAASAMFGFVRNIVTRVVGAAWNWIKGAFNSVKGAVQSAASSMWSAVERWVTRPVGDAFQWIKDAIDDAVDYVRDKVNGLISKWNDLEFSVSIPHGPDISVGTPNLSPIATGVRNFAGGLALVGEEGPEILNLPRGADVLTNAASRRALDGGNLGGNVFNIEAPGGDLPDVESMLAQIDVKLRARGGFG